MNGTSNTSTTIARTVIRINDDRETPTRGRVIGWEDEDRCLVLWGDDRYSNDPDRARVEFADELTACVRMNARLGQVNSTTRPAAHRIVDGSDFHVELDLDGVADTLLDQIAAVLHREHRVAQIMLLGNPVMTPAERVAIRAELKAALTLARAFDVPLFPQQADDLASDLWEATTEPSWCDCAEAYATRPDGKCDGCGAKADVTDASLTQLRAV